MRREKFIEIYDLTTVRPPHLKSWTLILVLRGRDPRVWKLVDFGLTSEATSRTLITSKEAKGSGGYRPPDMITDDKPTFNSKTDIWALGCILYELVVGRRLFLDDWKVYRYTQSPHLLLPIGALVNVGWATTLQRLILQMLQIDPSNRLSAFEMLKQFAFHYEFQSRGSDLESCVLPEANFPHYYFANPGEVFQESVLCPNSTYCTMLLRDYPVATSITALICDVSQGMAVLGSLILPDLRHPARVKLCHGNLGLNLFHSGKRFFGVYPVSESARRGLGYEMSGIKAPVTAPDITASGDTVAWLIGLGSSVAVMHLGLEQGDIRIQSFREISCPCYQHDVSLADTGKLLGIVDNHDSLRINIWDSMDDRWKIGMVEDCERIWSYRLCQAVVSSINEDLAIIVKGALLDLVILRVVGDVHVQYARFYACELENAQTFSSIHLAYSPCGSYLIYSSAAKDVSELVIWKTRPRYRQVWSHPIGGGSVWFCRDGQLLCVCDTFRRKLFCINFPALRKRYNF
jgi:hypothetical protein